MILRPWGSLDWLLPKIQAGKWHIVTSASFEDRCVAVVEWFVRSRAGINSYSLYRITNPETNLWEKCKSDIDKNFVKFHELFSAVQGSVVDVNLLDSPGVKFSSESLNPDGFDSIVLDVTTLPKKFFLFALKKLIDNKKIKNLIVTYAKAAEYPEIPLCEKALPPTAFPGFGRTQPLRGKPRMIVGVGYMPLSVEDLLEKAKNSKLDFIFPFPPASPAFRRNWTLLSMLMPTDIPKDTEIHRINSMDAFEVFDRVVSWGRHQDLDLIPLGPKPHALGVAMASMRLDGHAEILYSQPQAYNHNYSIGMDIGDNGLPVVSAYCLKLEGKTLF